MKMVQRAMNEWMHEWWWVMGSVEHWNKKQETKRKRESKAIFAESELWSESQHDVPRDSHFLPHFF